MDWREKTVSMNHVKTEEFDTVLASIVVSENRVVVEPKDVKHWTRILHQVDERMLLEEVHWEDVASVSVTDNELYYPHIDIEIDTEDEADIVSVDEKRIYFVEGETDTMASCLKAIKRFWNAARQNSAGDDQRHRDDIDPDEADPSEDVELEDAIRQESQTEKERASDRVKTARERRIAERRKKIEEGKKEYERLQAEVEEDESNDGRAEADNRVEEVEDPMITAADEEVETPEQDIEAASVEDRDAASGKEDGSDDTTMMDDEAAATEEEDDEEENPSVVDDMVERFMESD